jgi:hypothetical protein
MLEIADLPAARAAADELAAMAGQSDARYLRALAAHAAGTVRLASGDAQGALTALRQAWMDWQEIDAPWDAARVRVLLGLACRALGNDGSAPGIRRSRTRVPATRRRARPCPPQRAAISIHRDGRRAG